MPSFGRPAPAGRPSLSYGRPSQLRAVADLWPSPRRDNPRTAVCPGSPGSCTRVGPRSTTVIPGAGKNPRGKHVLSDARGLPPAPYGPMGHRSSASAREAKGSLMGDCAAIERPAGAMRPLRFSPVRFGHAGHWADPRRVSAPTKVPAPSRVVAAHPGECAPLRPATAGRVAGADSGAPHGHVPLYIHYLAI